MSEQVETLESARPEDPGAAQAANPGRKQLDNLDGVFEGGGVKGIGLIGALSVIEANGGKFARVAGTSAGAIVASLVAAGYSAAEMKRIMNGIHFKDFEDSSAVGKIPGVGQVVDELFKKGLYEGNYFLHLMRGLLSGRGIHTFRDLIADAKTDDIRYRYKLQVVASDITARRMLVLPQDAQVIGYAPDDLEVALAVRMSMSIPFFFMPVQVNGHFIVDGGLLSNFPVELFDVQTTPRWPTFGFKLVSGDKTKQGFQVVQPIDGPLAELAAMFFTAMEAHDAYYLSADKFVRTIAIDTVGVSSTNFDLQQPDEDRLYQSGIDAATSFLDSWDFDQYVAVYRSNAPIPTRRDALRALAAQTAAPAELAPVAATPPVGDTKPPTSKNSKSGN